MQTQGIQEKEVFGMVLGKLVTQLREQRGLKQVELAAQLNISQPVLSRIESGKVQPDAYLFEQLASALGTTVPALSANVREAMARTASAAAAATHTNVETPAQAWNQAVAVAGVVGLLSLIGFAVAAALSSSDAPTAPPASPKAPGPKPS
ncbi:helix-turn-helix domain-containing protein [Myxococcus sp. RHSTA-1-4]|uniref:helix-turn-helix domain-containing protein n=1 Tax=Myxococcus sp. RHSTA-1-4 TaxID=2874601 RepID=UPI001CC04919|nr:helix-turn-helix transcriptional regulator [Myxococcus sp. RHSTA-1-4]MBZ4421766.1 helix-turn-helix domain-containing protein [Myxococcus sp. RHSTA-1-4]